MVIGRLLVPSGGLLGVGESGERKGGAAKGHGEPRKAELPGVAGWVGQMGRAVGAASEATPERLPHAPQSSSAASPRKLP